MFSDYCPIISAEASNGDVIEFFSDRNEEKVSIPFWMYYHSAEVHRACRLTGPVAGVSPACILLAPTPMPEHQISVFGSFFEVQGLIFLCAQKPFPIFLSKSRNLVP